MTDDKKGDLLTKYLERINEAADNFRRSGDLDYLHQARTYAREAEKLLNKLLEDSVK